MEEIEEVGVPRMGKGIVEVVRIFPPGGLHQRSVEQLVHVAVSYIMEDIVEVVRLITQERFVERTGEHMVNLRAHGRCGNTLWRLSQRVTGLRFVACGNEAGVRSMAFCQIVPQELIRSRFAMLLWKC